MPEPKGAEAITRPQKQANRAQFGALLRRQPSSSMFSQHDNVYDDDFQPRRKSNASRTSGSGSPDSSSSPSPWNQTFPTSPWIAPSPMNVIVEPLSSNDGLIGTIVREEGHVYSLASSGDLLYTGSDSKNIRVWKNMREFSAFKSNSGFVKAIVIAGDRIYTGHLDGKIRIWTVSTKNPSLHKRIGSLPSKKDMVRGSMMNPKNLKNNSHLRIKHFDAVSCMSLNQELGLLYSGSWDKTMKVWRIANSKCLETVHAHEDAINSVVTGFDGFVFTGSADGSVKVWRRELQGKKTQHMMVQILLKQDNAVTGLAVNLEDRILYCGSSDGNVNFWEHLNHGGVLRGHKLAVLCVAAAGKLVLSGSADKTVCVWKREGVGEHTRLKVLSGHMGPVKCLAVEPDLSNSNKEEDHYDQRWILYSGSLDKTLKVWRVLDNINHYSMNSRMI